LLTYRELLLTGPEAVCVLDPSLGIKQHNQLLSILLGYQNRDIKGRHLSDILYDDLLIRRLLELQDGNGWLHGEYVLRTNSNFPLKVILRAGLLLSSIPDYIPSDYSFEKEYALVFRESDEIRYSDYNKISEALMILLDAISKHDKSLEDIIHNFAKTFDQNVKVILISQDNLENINNDTEIQLPIPESLLEYLPKIIREKKLALLVDETTWGFLHIYSSAGSYSLA
jgi:hypothetical protein